MADERKVDDGGPAFPTLGDDTMQAPGDPGRIVFKSAYGMHGEPGMSLRDYFAAHAMAGLLACPRPPLDPACPDGSGPVSADLVAAHAYTLADALLAARKVPS